MANLFETGRIVDCILAFMACELSVLMLLRRRTGARFSPVELTVNIGAGAALLLALRAALRGEPWPGVAMWLMASFVLHGVEMALRWSEGRTR